MVQRESNHHIGNESQVLRLISETIGKARIYAFGVGTSVNRYLLAEMARLGLETTEATAANITVNSTFDDLTPRGYLLYATRGSHRFIGASSLPTFVPSCRVHGRDSFRILSVVRTIR